MKKEIKLPEISENAEAAIVAEVMVAEGDHVEESQPLIAVESDKATVEVPAEFAGTIKNINVKESDEIRTGDVILTLETDEEDKQKGKDKPQDEKEGPQNKEQQEEKDEKRDVESSAQKQPEKKEKKDEPPSNGREKSGQTTEKSFPAAPLARKLARELDIDLQDVREKESEDSRITSSDIMRYVKHLLEEKLKKGSKAAVDAEDIGLPDFSKWGETEKETLSGVRKATAKTTSQSWRNIPHVTQFDEADVTELENYRKKLQKEDDLKISLTAILVKLLAEGLKKFPRFNSSIDIANNEVIYKKYYNISIAVDTPKGLFMPVMKNADRKNIQSITEELKELVRKALDGKLDKEAMEGGNIAISNLGPIGGTSFTPVIFPPQVAILGIGGLKTIPRYDESKKEFVPRKMIPLALSYDHRVIDGADAARFTHWLCDTLENPIHVFVK